MDMIYFDHNATTPVHPDVFETMKTYLTEEWGNASCLYPIGVNASYAVEKARMQVARLINAAEEEIVFTGCGTESDNMALKGSVFATGKKHIITSSIEHPAIWQTCDFLGKHEGCTYTKIPVDGQGFVNPKDVEAAITGDTAIVSIMMANNEIGSIQPIKEIAEITRKHGVIFHTDAIQAVGRIPVDVQELGVDLLSISGHKLYGPKGVGALYVRKDTRIISTMIGGGQEAGFRGGTENVAGIAGLGKATQLARKELDHRISHCTEIREAIWDKLNALGLDIRRNSPSENCLPGTLNVAIPNINAREFVRTMGDIGICLASGSACSSGKTQPSHVIKAIGKSDEDATSSIRISVGGANTHEHINKLIEVLPGIIAQVREKHTLASA